MHGCDQSGWSKAPKQAHLCVSRTNRPENGPIDRNVPPAVSRSCVTRKDQPGSAAGSEFHAWDAGRGGDGRGSDGAR